jgi:hypothetical protein
VVPVPDNQFRWRVTTAATPAVNHSSTMPQYVPGMYETQILAARALRELLDDPDRTDRG